MDAVKFVREYLRMCAKVPNCEECPAFMTDFCTVNAEEQSPESAEKVVQIIEKWSVEHPQKTRQSVFMEQWPNAKVFVDGVLDFCPMELDSHYLCKATDVKMPCQSCRRKFWMQEVK